MRDADRWDEVDFGESRIHGTRPSEHSAKHCDNLCKCALGRRGGVSLTGVVAWLADSVHNLSAGG